MGRQGGDEMNSHDMQITRVRNGYLVEVPETGDFECHGRNFSQRFVFTCPVSLGHWVTEHCATELLSDQGVEVE